MSLERAPVLHERTMFKAMRRMVASYSGRIIVRFRCRSLYITTSGTYWKQFPNIQWLRVGPAMLQRDLSAHDEVAKARSETLKGNLSKNSNASLLNANHT